MIDQANDTLMHSVENDLNSGESMFELVTTPHYRRP